RMARLLTVLVLVAAGGAIRAQAPAPLVEEAPSLDEHFHYLGRDVARAKFTASRAEPRVSAQGMSDAALGQLDARYREFLAGRGTFAFLQESLRLWLDAELLLSDRPADHLAAYEAYWQLALDIEQMNRGRFEA